MNKNEVWKDVKNYEGIYQVSNLGRVKSLKRKNCLKDRILKAGKENRGYLLVVLFIDKKGTSKRVHQLVAEAFLNHKPNGAELVVNHKDFNKTNNNVKNLEVITQRANKSHREKKGTSKYVGVSWDKATNEWKTRIYIKGKNKYLGSFKCELSAHLAYQKALQTI